MTSRRVAGELDHRYSSSGAEPVHWDEVESILNTAEIFWFVSVRADGRPHSVPLMAIWMESAMFIATGAEEQKARNLATDPAWSLTTGCNLIGSGLDVTIDGTAAIEEDFEMLTMLAARYDEKYGWQFTVRDGKLEVAENNIAIVYWIEVNTVYGFGKGDSYSQTRWKSRSAA